MGERQLSLFAVERGLMKAAIEEGGAKDKGLAGPLQKLPATARALSHGGGESV